MKKTNILKVLMSLLLALGVTGVFAQNTPSSSTTTFTTVTNFVEVIQSDIGNAGSGTAGVTTATDNTHFNFVTVGSDAAGATIVQITGTTTNPGTMYATSQPALDYLIPLSIIPDQVLNPGSFTAGTATYTFANLTSSIWNWSIPAALDLDNVLVDATETGTEVTDFAAQGTAFTVAGFPQKYVNTGRTTGNFTVEVNEQSVTADGNTALCNGSDAYVNFTVVAAPSAADGGDPDDDDCIANLENTETSLAITLTGTPPFIIGYWINEATIIGGVETPSYTYTYVITGNADTDQSTDAATKYTGTLTGGGTNWVYTIPLGIDELLNDQAFDNEVSLIGNDITKYEIGVAWVNDLYSRKSDRLGAVGDPTAPADALNHVMYEGAGSLALTLYPTPSTGNIFTLPN